MSRFNQRPYSLSPYGGSTPYTVEETVITGIVSAESFLNIFYILRKLSSSKQAFQQIKNLRAIVNISPVYDSTIDLALHSGWNDFEDAVQYYCAVENSCDAIVTRNSSDFKESDIPVFTPIQYIEHYLA